MTVDTTCWSQLEFRPKGPFLRAVGPSRNRGSRVEVFRLPAHMAREQIDNGQNDEHLRLFPSVKESHLNKA